jgi:transcriptional regulator with XRE-family HTH domain
MNAAYLLMPAIISDHNRLSKWLFCEAEHKSIRQIANRLKLAKRGAGRYWDMMAKRRADPTPDNVVRDTIGALVRDIRKRREMTLEQLSEQTGISVSSLSRIENTQLGLTIEKIELLAHALGVSPQTLVSRNRPSRHRPSARRSGSPDSDGLRFMVDRVRDRQTSLDRELSIEYLFERQADRSLDCLHLTVQAISIWDSEFVRHPGEKIIYVISGAAVIYCEKQSPVVLEKGDSLYMDANVWHSVVAVNGSPAELLVTYYHGPSAGDGPFETQIFSPERWAALQAA